MAGEASEVIGSALEELIGVTEKSKNLRSDLKEVILKSVSNLRKYFCELKSVIEEKDKLVNEAKTEIKKCEDKIRSETSAVNNIAVRGPSATLSEGTRNSYATAVREKRSTDRPEVSYEKNYKLILKSKNNESPEAMKVLLKRHINPTQLKVGVNALKSLRDGRLILESRSKEDIEVLSKEIEVKCGQHIDVNTPQLRNPNVIIFNVPYDITVENAAGIITSQNPELYLSQESLTPRFTFKTKSNIRNIVIEVKPECWRTLVQKKIKMGWQICSVDDYIKVNRCYHCSKYNHKAQNCKGKQTCPLCTGSHKLSECTAEEEEYKCTNCMTFNKYNMEKVDEKHSSLDKNCPCMQAMIKRYKQNTEY